MVRFSVRKDLSVSCKITVIHDASSATQKMPHKKWERVFWHMTTNTPLLYLLSMHTPFASPSSLNNLLWNSSPPDRTIHTLELPFQQHDSETYERKRNTRGWTQKRRFSRSICTQTSLQRRSGRLSRQNRHCTTLTPHNPLPGPFARHIKKQSTQIRHVLQNWYAKNNRTWGDSIHVEGERYFRPASLSILCYKFLRLWKYAGFNHKTPQLVRIW